MKKLFIALPLVLIMILTMIPVMAVEGEGSNDTATTCEFPGVVVVEVNTFNNPGDTEVAATVTYTHNGVKEEDATEAKLIEMAEADAAKVEKPHDRVPADKWKVEVVKPVETFKEDADPCQEELKVVVNVYPLCITEEETTSSTCPTLCNIITVKAVNVVDGATVASRGYGVKPNVAPSYKKMLDHFMANEMPGNFKIVSNWFGQPWIDYPALLSNCVLEIKVIPVLQQVNVIHKLYTCCENLDGTKSYSLWKSFVEQNVFVDFVDYHSKLVFDHSKAKEFATTRLERVNAQDFVFIRAIFNDGINLDEYLTGKLYDMDGNEIGKFGNDDPRPTIILEYHHVNCVDKAEEKVDNAQVNAGQATTNQAPAQQLPATGAKDITAFFLSAVALLGLGIFFAKKH